MSKVRFVIEDGSKVYGAKYWTVMPTWDSWGDRTLYWDSLTDWCKDTFGGTGDLFNQEPVAKWYANSGRIWIRDEKDLTAFLLRWDNVNNY